MRRRTQQKAAYFRASPGSHGAILMPSTNHPAQLNGAPGIGLVVLVWPVYSLVEVINSINHCKPFPLFVGVALMSDRAAMRLCGTCIPALLTVTRPWRVETLKGARLASWSGHWGRLETQADRAVLKRGVQPACNRLPVCFQGNMAAVQNVIRAIAQQWVPSRGRTC